MNEKNLINEINKLRKEKNAVILAHNYQIEEIQEIADFVGDSLELSYKASQTFAKTIVFCGVRFMAETAHLISPEKTVLLPELDAGCPLADSLFLQDLEKLKNQHPQAKVVCYVNSSAQIKANSDICCTSANAVKVVNYIEGEEIIFIPDKNLGQYVRERTKKKIYLSSGSCPVHNVDFSLAVKKLKEKYPAALFICHPECPPSILKIADYIASTSGILEFAKKTAVKDIIVGTEEGIIHRLKKENPEKNFYLARPNFICEDMKKITLKSLYLSLKENKYVITVPVSIREKAFQSIDKMLEINKNE